MASVNMSSIMSKVNAYMESDEGKNRSQAVVDQYVKQGKRVTAAGSKVLTTAEMTDLSNKLAAQVAAMANGYVAESVSGLIETLTPGKPVQVGPLEYSIELTFTGNKHRDSLQPQNYSGIDNIIALMNNGYDAPNAKYVQGYWHGVYTHGLPHREGLGFMQAAVNDFNNTYGHLGVHAELSSEYN